MAGRWKWGSTAKGLRELGLSPNERTPDYPKPPKMTLATIGFEPSSSRSFERDSKRRRSALRVNAAPFTFLNYTKMTKYEALEKNAVSETEMPQLENLQYSPIRRNGPLCWGIFGLSHGPQCKGDGGGGRGTGVEPSPRGPAWRKATQRSGPQVASQNLANDGRSGKGRQRPFAEPKHPTVNFLACVTSDGSPSSGVTLPLARKPVPAWHGKRCIVLTR